MLKKPELLAPAGNYSRMVYAIEYGADAVYVGGEEYSLRTASNNFSCQELEKAVDFAHVRGKRLYVACNAVPRNGEIDRLPEYASFLEKIGVDAVIISDLGSLRIFRRYAPQLTVHVSTQANTVNYEACRSWYELGAQRIVLGRELSLEEIVEIRSRIPKDCELEIFVHGAMCMAHSGRCLLSDFLTGRDSNRGDCAQPCRWKYTLTEEKRPGEHFPVLETDNGTYFLNSKDLCMIEHLPELCNAGITSFKIEGRAKTEYYVAGVTQAYRMALDDCFEDVERYAVNLPQYREEVNKVSHRPYYTGFFFPENNVSGQNYEDSSYIRAYELAGIIEGYDSLHRRLLVSQRNKIFAGEEYEILEAGKASRTFRIEKMYDEEGNSILFAPHAEQKVSIEYPSYVGTHSFLRKRKI